MAVDKSVTLSKELFKIFASLNVKNVLGKTIAIRKTDDGHACARFDEGSKNVFFYLLFDEYSFNFPNNEICFNDIGVFLEICKRQGFGKDPTFKMSRMADKRGGDIIQVYNKKSAMTYRLYNLNAYPEDIGLAEDLTVKTVGTNVSDIVVDDVDPESFSILLTASEIDDISDCCNNQHFKCDTFYFSKKTDCLVLCFTGPNDMEYRLRIERERINNFDKIDVGEEIKFGFNCFSMMAQIGWDYKISLLNQDSHYNVLCTSQLIVDNQSIKSVMLASSRVSNE